MMLKANEQTLPTMVAYDGDVLQTVNVILKWLRVISYIIERRFICLDSWIENMDYKKDAW